MDGYQEVEKDPARRLLKNDPIQGADGSDE
jgi:hypothetical protein